MNRQMTCGTSSISFQNPVFVQSCASVVSQKEGKGHWAHTLIPYVKIPCLEQIPGKLQKALCKNRPLCWQSKKRPHLFRYTASFCRRPAGSDISLFFRNRWSENSFYGLFGACSTMGESLSLGSMCIDGGYGKYILCATSSHFASAEKEFRFPWDMEIKGPYLLPGQSPVPEPVYLDMNRHHARTTKH